jgi:GPH family glycoside/pentoside/hexuronide:cation symporter
MLWVAVPYGVLAVAAFITPDATVGQKLVYAYISYALLMTAYTAVNVPYSALGGVMTGDSEERGNLQTWRFAMAMVGGFLVTASVFPLAKLLGGGDQPENYRLGFPFAMTVMAIIGVVCFLLCFKLTREYVYPAEKDTKRSVAEDLLGMFTNSQWLIIALATLIIMTRGAMQSAAKPYFVNYYLITDHMPAWLQWFLGSTSSKLSAFLGMTMLAGVAGAITANALGNRWCKVSVMKLALTGTITMNVLLFLIPRDAVLGALLLVMSSNFFHMMFVPMLFSTVPDTVDYGLKTTGKGAMAMFCAGHLFALKMGNAFGGFFTGHFLGWFGYQPNVEQTPHALTGIMIAFAGSSIVGGVLVIICLQFYRLKRGWQDRITAT